MRNQSLIPRNRPGENADKVVWQTHNRDWHWAYNLMLFGLFFGLFSLVSAGGKTLVSHYFLARLVVFCCLFGLLIPIRFYNKLWSFGSWEAVMFNLLGVGPVICGLLLWTNVLFCGEAKQEIHHVIDARISTGGFAGTTKIIFELQNGAWVEHPEVRGVEFEFHKRKVVRATQLIISIADGALGYPVWESTEPIVED